MADEPAGKPHQPHRPRHRLVEMHPEGDRVLGAMGIDMGDSQLNAQCNNRFARITELEWELAATDDPILSGAIEERNSGDASPNRSRQAARGISGLWSSKATHRRGRFRRGRISDDAVFLCNYVQRSAPYQRALLSSKRKSLLALIGGTTLIGLLANLITIKDSDLVNRLKELLQEFLRM